MRSFKETISFSREKHENWGMEDRCKELGFNSEPIPYIGYETMMEIEVFEDGTNKVLSINGIDVSEKNISV